MVRTRAATASLAKVEEPREQLLNKHQVHVKQEERVASPESDAETAEDDKRPSSFNGKLQKFQYGTITSIESSGSKKAPTASTMTTPARRVLKRTLEQSVSTDNPILSSHSPAKKRRTPSKYAPPSKYAHLPPLKDILAPDLICVFVGTNPGIRTASAGHAYAHPSNLFWKLLYSSGCTDRRLRPEEDGDLPRLYAMGNTNIVERPTKDAAELSREEMAAGTPVLEEKVRKWRPEAVCIVGKGIWEAVWRWRYGRAIGKREFAYGWQDEAENMGRCEEWGGARVFVATSTSGLSASTRPAEKEEIWRPFGEWVKRRRAERAAAEGVVAGSTEPKFAEPTSTEPT